MFNYGYYPGTSSGGAGSYDEKHRKHHHKHSHKDNPDCFSTSEHFRPGPGKFSTASGNNVSFTLLIIALIFLVKNKSKLYA